MTLTDCCCSGTCPALNPAKDPQALAFQHSTSHLPPSVSCPSTIDPAELAAVPSASSAATAAGTAATGNGGPSSGTGAGGALSESMDDLRLSPASRRRDDDEDDEDADEDAIGGGDGRERWKVSCGLVIHRLDDGFVARANHIPTYFELNRQVRRGLPSGPKETSSPSPLLSVPQGPRDRSPGPVGHAASDAGADRPQSAGVDRLDRRLLHEGRRADQCQEERRWPALRHWPERPHQRLRHHGLCRRWRWVRLAPYPPA
jgi:hypothetical protein